MCPTSNPPASGLLSRLTDVVLRPRRAMASAVALESSAVAMTWALGLLIWLGAAGWLLSLPVGRQAVVDERVRVVEALGGRVSDAQYAAWQQRPPWSTYFTSGGRLLLLPATTLAVATGLFLWLRRRAGAVGYRAALSVAVHASLVLVLQQVLATPLHALRESLTSPFNLAALVPLFDEGSLPARILGAVEVFGLWWAALLAMGAAALAGGRARHYLGPLLGVYVGVAIVVAAVVGLIGGS